MKTTAAFVSFLFFVFVVTWVHETSNAEVALFSVIHAGWRITRKVIIRHRLSSSSNQPLAIILLYVTPKIFVSKPDLESSTSKTTRTPCFGWPVSWPQ